uniref:Uncharacterized protein n=1 Tax=Rhizophagus irregularis (strain DAOM 181602 / DAOM 197198 / MUCL 43194) TaxID=747089 RepID=U9TSA3_RHIID
MPIMEKQLKKIRGPTAEKSSGYLPFTLAGIRCLLWQYKGNQGNPGTLGGENAWIGKNNHVNLSFFGQFWVMLARILFPIIVTD